MKKDYKLLKIEHKTYKIVPKVTNIDLSSLSTEPRYVQTIDTERAFTGISTKKYGRQWFIVGGKQALFKTFDEHLAIVEKERIANELICYHLANRLGINAAKCQKAHIGDQEGLISYNFLKEHDLLISADDMLERETYEQEPKNILNNYKSSIEYIANLNKLKVDVEKIMEQLFKIAVFDLMTLQQDRHVCNISFIMTQNEKGENELVLAPLFDNELAFMVRTKDRGHDYSLNYRNLADDERCFLCSRISIYGDVDGVRKSNKEEALDMFKFAENNEKYMKFLNKIMNFDIKSFFNELRMFYKVNISEDYEKHCIECFEYGRDLLIQACQKVQDDEFKLQEENKLYDEKLNQEI